MSPVVQTKCAAVVMTHWTWDNSAILIIIIIMIIIIII